MLRFIFRLAVFCTVGFVVFNLLATAILSSANPLSRRLSWFRVHQRVLASRTPINDRTLILGDSIAGQFFPFGAEPGFLTCNGSIFAIGHYILAANVVDTSPAVERIVLASVPHILGKNIESRKTFNNVVQPFWTIGQRKHFSSLAQAKMAARPPSALFIFPGTKLLPVSDIDFSNGLPSRDDVLSDIAVNYLRRLDTLCVENGIELRLVSPPVRRRLKTETKNWCAMRRQIRREGLDSVFDGYFAGIRYLRNDQFRDNVHLKASAVDRCRLGMADLVRCDPAAD